MSFMVSLDIDESLRFMVDWPVVFDGLFMDPLVEAPWLAMPVELDEPDVVALDVVDEGVGLALGVAGIVDEGFAALGPAFAVPVPGDAPPVPCATERPAPRAREAAAARVRMGDSFLMIRFLFAKSRM